MTIQLALLAGLAVTAEASAGAAAGPPTCAIPAGRPVFRNNADGGAISGSKEDLLKAIRRGDPVRVAWGAAFRLADGSTGSVEHTADPVFLTIINQRDVAVQLPEHIAQAAYHELSGARFETPSVMWRGLMTSDGRFDAVWVDRATGKEIRRLPQRASITWLVFAPESACDSRQPLELAVPDGVRRDSARP